MFYGCIVRYISIPLQNKQSYMLYMLYIYIYIHSHHYVFLSMSYLKCMHFPITKFGNNHLHIRLVPHFCLMRLYLWVITDVKIPIQQDSSLIFTIPRSIIRSTSVRLVESSTKDTFLMIPAYCKIVKTMKK